MHQLALGYRRPGPLEDAEEITGEPTNERLCSSHVVRIESFDSPRGNLGWALNLIATKFLSGPSVDRRRVIGSRAGKRYIHKPARRPPAVDAAVAAT